jgi:hypothetical protein
MQIAPSGGGRNPRRAGAALVAAGLAATAVVAFPLSRGGGESTATAPGAAAARQVAAQRGAQADSVYRAFAPGATTRSAAAAAAATASAAPPSNGGLRWRVGVDKESLDPSAADLASNNFHLGGYGIFPTRQSHGPLVDADGQPEHLYVSAMAITDPSGHHALLLAALENQGTFTADKEGPYGIWDMRQKVAHDLHISTDSIVIDSDHSHAGPDLIGLWGGVPNDYLQRVHDQAVTALETAFRNRVPAQLLVGTDIPTMPTPQAAGYIPGTATVGENLVHSQFSPDTQTGYDDSLVDTELRVLQAVDGSGAMIGTLINYAAHATVMGSGNVGYSADWPGRVARATEAALGESVAVPMVADVGRSQPPRPHSNPACGQPNQESCDLDQLDTYTRILTPFVLSAVATAVPVTGHGIDNREVMTREVGVNGALVGVSYTGEVPVRGYGAYRAATPPWFTGDVIGTFASAHRIGDVLFTVAPGEAYPDVRFGVKKEVRGEQALFTFGLANDQLGYLIAPTTEYPWIATSNPGNDNALFNVSPQYGDHLMCTHTALAVELGFTPTGDPQPYGSAAPAPPCAALTATDLVPVGPTPQQPWPFGDGVDLPPPFPQ